MKVKLLAIIVLLLTAMTQGVEAQTHVSKLKTRTADAEKWTVSPNPAEEGATVNATYTGRKKVMSVQAEKNPYTDLSMVDCAGNERQSQWTANCYMVHTAGKYRLPLVYGNAIKNGEANTAAYTGTDNWRCTQTFPNHEGNAINAPWITKSTDGQGADRGMGISVASAELLWQDAQGLVTEVGIKGDYLTLTVGKDATEQEGNAVVAAKTADGTIVWSWHIWVTRQTFAEADLATFNTGKHIYKLTPVNVGWVGDRVSAGYSPYFQWGRKDAFIPADLTKLETEGGETIGGGSSGGIGIGGWTTTQTIYAANLVVYDINDNEVTGIKTLLDDNATVADNIKNPTTLYRNVNLNGSYYFHKLSTPNQNPALNWWNAQQDLEVGSNITPNVATATVKTVFDPCPAGFCVPTNNLFVYFESLGNNALSIEESIPGRTLTDGESSVFFPFIGYRLNTADGTVTRVSSVDQAYYASSTCKSSTNYDTYYVAYDFQIYLLDRKDPSSAHPSSSSLNCCFALPVRAVAEE